MEYRIGDIWRFPGNPDDWFRVTGFDEDRIEILLNLDNRHGPFYYPPRVLRNYKLDESSRVTRILNEYKS